MRCYIAHSESDIDRAGEIAQMLQISHPENAYFSPLHAFAFLSEGDLSNRELKEIRHDILSACDVLIVASVISEQVREDINFARLVNMEVLRLEECGALRPFTE